MILGILMYISNDDFISKRMYATVFDWNPTITDKNPMKSSISSDCACHINPLGFDVTHVMSLLI